MNTIYQMSCNLTFSINLPFRFFLKKLILFKLNIYREIMLDLLKFISEISSKKKIYSYTIKFTQIKLDIFKVNFLI